MTTPILTVSHLNQYYGDWQVLHDINLAIAPGEVVALLGPSGSGKSTLIRTLNGLEPLHDGEITFQGTPIDQKKWPELRQKIGMVFQSYDLFPNLTVLDNITLAPQKVQHRSRADAEAEARQLLERVGLADHAQAYPRELSGGQQQRVAIVRALAMHPDLMLFDEVTASLDPEMVRGVLAIIKELAVQDQMTMVIVTHEMNFAAQVADRVLFLENGRLVETTPAKQFFTQPQSDRAAEFLTSMDF